MNKQLDIIKKYSRLFSRAARWHSSNETISDIQSMKNKTKQAEYIYEFYCYLRVLKDLKNTYDLEYVAGSGVNEHCFPKAPAKKANRPYFILKHKGTNRKALQVCTGIEIEGKVKKRKPAPDISFLKPGAKASPTYKDVLIIHDAKYNREKSDKEKVSLTQFYYVSGMMRDLRLDRKINCKIKFKHLADLAGNCILTNKDSYSKDDDVCRSHYLKEVENFDVNKKLKAFG